LSPQQIVQVNLAGNSGAVVKILRAFKTELDLN